MLFAIYAKQISLLGYYNPQIKMFLATENDYSTSNNIEICPPDVYRLRLKSIRWFFFLGGRNCVHGREMNLDRAN